MSIMNIHATSDGGSRIPYLRWENPCYPKYSHYRSVNIPNCSVLNYACDGIIGFGIRTMSDLNDVPNPLGLTHTGVAIHAIPKILVEDIIKLSETKGSNLYENDKVTKEMINNIRKYYPDAGGTTQLSDSDSNFMQVFCAEENGSAGEVLKGIYPHLYVVPLEHDAINYTGDIYFRPLKIEVPYERSYEILKKYLGTPYESPFTLLEMVNAIGDKNVKDETQRLFCSEFVALFYKKLEVIPENVIVSNVIPEKLSSGAGENDILKDVADQDIPIRHENRFFECDCVGCCGFFK